MTGKKFLFLTSFSLPEHAGSGINAFNFANFLNKKGIDTTILTFNRNIRLKNVEVIDKTKIIRIPYFNKNLLLKVLSIPNIIFNFIIQIFRCDILYIYGSKIILYELAIIMALILRKKIIFRSLLLGIDDMNIICNERKTFHWMYRFLFRNIDCYYSINPEFSRHFIEQIKKPERILEISQGIDVSKFFSIDSARKVDLRLKLGLPPGLILMSAGFLIRRKGYKMIFNSLKNLDIPFTYIILGDYRFKSGHFLAKSIGESDELIILGKSLLKNKIQFRGFVQNINEYLQCADIFIQGSRQEGLPNALLEAMATGLPIVSYNIDGLNNFFLMNGENCLIYNSFGELVHLILKIKNDTSFSSYLKKNAEQYVIKHSSFEITSEMLFKKLS